MTRGSFAFGLKWLALFLAATSGLGYSWAQTAPAPTFPSAVELITVDAVVVDDQDRPVVGLTKDDFVLLEEGQPQEIANFEGVTLPGADEGPGAAPPPAASAPRIATNAPPARKASTALVIVDDIHLTGSEAARARTTLERFLRAPANQGGRITIVSTGTGAAWSGTLPADRDDLLAVVSRVPGRK